MTEISQDLEAKRAKGTLAWLIGTGVFVLECAAGYYYNVYVGYYHSDGISRVANAFYVLYSRNPHLGAIGFVWNPLPSMVDLIFLLLYPLIPALATKGIAGLLMSALFASLTVSVLVRAFINRGLSPWYGVCLTLLFALNPMIFLTGFNGLSDAPFIFFIILSIVAFLNWVDAHELGDLAVSSFAVATAFWCRYEAVPFGFSIIVSCVIVTMFINKVPKPHSEGRFHYNWSRAEGTLAVIVTPLLYSIILWILLNAIIMHNPLNFLNGDYTNTAQIQGHLNDSIYAVMLNNPLKASMFAFTKVLIFSIPLLAILILRLLNRRILRWDTLILIGMIVSIPVLQIIMLMKGTSLGWLRYFLYVLPVSFAWLPYELSKIKNKWQMVIPLIAMLLNLGVLSYVITQPLIAPDENTFLQNSFGQHNQTYYDQKQDIEIAEYLDQNYPSSNILVDSFSAYLIILESKFPKRFYITSDYFFKNAVSHPQEYNINYLLVPKPGSASVLSAINDAYPNLYYNGSDWAELVKEFGTRWRLYKVIK
ncbi:glycosyltransferase family 39 protein [Desulfosporosinus sp. PR]|uniref:ArnT family glycosyltransferase n=1 Tax=Candidatus Desulfosporosinus nitrosoreducens TaxID=3401928 RepID=UPI0027F0DBF8|nr:glycosyltransferase family 39 protein [Desulfosporosinus sp. PR]MDQ7095548.1 glycosyltransferase family 39 protein [Desulfosporosinus sp. PR]